MTRSFVWVIVIVWRWTVLSFSSRRGQTTPAPEGKWYFCLNEPRGRFRLNAARNTTPKSTVTDAYYFQKQAQNSHIRVDVFHICRIFVR
jgi:hypothetical protein